MTRAELLAEGLSFGEGPRWHDGELWLSDFYQHAIKSLAMDGRITIRFEVPTQPSGLGWLPDGRLLAVSMLDRKVLRQEGSRLVEHADLSGLATFHCNDMVVDASGRAYVGNFGFDLEGEIERRGTASVFADHAKATLACVDPDGSVHVAAEGLDFPNGSVITPDGRTLIVAETFGAKLTAFDIAANGTLSNRRTWAETPGRSPDGICLDADGCVWISNPRAPEAVRFREGGEVVGVVETDQPTYAVMLGGPDGRTLFCLTAATSNAAEAAKTPTGNVLVAKVSSPRAGWP